MARNRVATFCEVNISCNPHPENIYRDLLKQSEENAGVPYGRKWFAKIGSVKQRKDGLVSGVLGVWRDFDAHDAAINEETLDQVQLSSLVGDIPDGFGFPSKRFSFAFRPADHRMVIQLKNDEGESIQPGALQKALVAILNDAGTLLEVDVSVTIIPEVDVLKEIFSMSAVRRLNIDLYVPNPGDDLGEEKERILRELREAKIQRSSRQVYKRKSVGSIEFSDALAAEVELAAENGKVSAIGVDEYGVRKKLETSEHPRIIKRELFEADTSAGALISVAKRGG